MRRESGNRILGGMLPCPMGFWNRGPDERRPPGTGSTIGALPTEISLVKLHLCRA